MAFLGKGRSGQRVRRRMVYRPRDKPHKEASQARMLQTSLSQLTQMPPAKPGLSLLTRFGATCLPTGHSRVTAPVRDQLRAAKTLEIHCGYILHNKLVLLKVLCQV